MTSLVVSYRIDLPRAARYALLPASPLILALGLLFGTSRADAQQALPSATPGTPDQPPPQSAEAPIKLNEYVVTGVFSGMQESKAPVAISTVDAGEIQSMQPVSALDLLTSVPGIYVDTSEGVVRFGVGNQVTNAPAITSRGLGFIQIEEDGLPLQGNGGFLSTQIGLAGLFRADDTLDHIEAVRGGSASITAANSPAGLINFFSKTGGDIPAGEFSYTYGLQGNGNLPYNRGDFNFGGPLPDFFGSTAPGWYYNVGGYYQHDFGTHDAGYALDFGGQVKANVLKRFSTGTLEIYAKYLNDHNAPVQPIPGVDWSNPRPAPGWSNTSSTLVPGISFQYPTGPGTYANFDSRNLEHLESEAIGTKLDLDIAGWAVSNNVKFTYTKDIYNISLNNFEETLDDFLPALVFGTLGTVGTYTFSDPANGTSAQVRTTDGLFGLGGVPATILSNNLPGTAGAPNAVMYEDLIGDRHTDSELEEQLSVTKQVGPMSFTAGLYYDFSKDYFFSNYEQDGLATFTPQPQLLQISLLEPNGQTLQLTNPQGIGESHGTGGVKNGFWNQFDTYFAHHWDVTPKLSTDWGVRYEKARSNVTDIPGSTGTISDSNNIYANQYTTLAGAVPYQGVRTIYTLGYSGAVSYKFNDDNLIYGRYSVGKNAPGLQSFTSAVNEAETLTLPETVTQWELGYKFRAPRYSLDVIGFYSLLSAQGYDVFNLGTYPVVTGPATVTTPANQTRDFGVELDGRYYLTDHLSLRTALTLQRPTELNSYNWVQTPGIYGTVANPFLGAVLTDTDSGYRAQDIPDVTATVTPRYTLGKFMAQVQWQYIGSREGNNNDAFVMPAYSQTNLTVQWHFTNHVSLTFTENNVFNSGGITDWGAPGDILTGYFTTGSYTRAQVLANPNAVFLIQQIAARAYFVKITYNF